MSASDRLRLGLLHEPLKKVAVTVLSDSFSVSSVEWKYLCPHQAARKLLLQSVYARIIDQSQSNGYVLFDSDQYDEDHIDTTNNNSCILGFMQIAAPNDKMQIKDYLLTCFDSLVLAPLHLQNGLLFIWKCIKLTSIIQYMMSDILTTHIGEYWYFNHLCIAHQCKGNGNGTKLLQLAHQKCAMDVKYDDLPIFVTTMTAKAVQFYVKNGYKLVMEIELDKNTRTSCYGLLYHYKQDRLDVLVRRLTESVEYKEEFNLFKHVLPQTAVQWIIWTNLLLIALPFVVLYLPAIWLTRCLSPESAWDLQD